jgi:MYXO-CTERM domain-containing protein
MYRRVTRKILYFRSLTMRALATAVLLALPTAAMAGVPATPGPEAGVGAAAMVAVAAGYLFLKRRRSR